MTATTIKVSMELRDRLNAEAKSSGMTAAQVIEQLLAERAQADRFRAIRAARDAMTPEQRAELAGERGGFEAASVADLT
jgi:hypothetical protein